MTHHPANDPTTLAIAHATELIVTAQKYRNALQRREECPEATLAQSAIHNANVHDAARRLNALMANPIADGTPRPQSRIHPASTAPRKTGRLPMNKTPNTPTNPEDPTAITEHADKLATATETYVDAAYYLKTATDNGRKAGIHRAKHDLRRAGMHIAELTGPPYFVITADLEDISDSQIAHITRWLTRALTGRETTTRDKNVIAAYRDYLAHGIDATTTLPPQLPTPKPTATLAGMHIGDRVHVPTDAPNVFAGATGTITNIVNDTVQIDFDRHGKVDMDPTMLRPLDTPTDTAGPEPTANSDRHRHAQDLANAALIYRDAVQQLDLFQQDPADTNTPHTAARRRQLRNAVTRATQDLHDIMASEPAHADNQPPAPGTPTKAERDLMLTRMGFTTPFDDVTTVHMTPSGIGIKRRKINDGRTMKTEETVLWPSAERPGR